MIEISKYYLRFPNKQELEIRFGGDWAITVDWTFEMDYLFGKSLIQFKEFPHLGKRIFFHGENKNTSNYNHKLDFKIEGWRVHVKFLYHEKLQKFVCDINESDFQPQSKTQMTSIPIETLKANYAFKTVIELVEEFGESWYNDSYYINPVNYNSIAGKPLSLVHNLSYLNADSIQFIFKDYRFLINYKFIKPISVEIGYQPDMRDVLDNHYGYITSSNSTREDVLAHEKEKPAISIKGNVVKKIKNKPKIVKAPTIQGHVVR